MSVVQFMSHDIAVWNWIQNTSSCNCEYKEQQTHTCSQSLQKALHAKFSFDKLRQIHLFLSRTQFLRQSCDGVAPVVTCPNRLANCHEVSAGIN